MILGKTLGFFFLIISCIFQLMTNSSWPLVLLIKVPINIYKNFWIVYVLFIFSILHWNLPFIYSSLLKHNLTF